MATALIIGDVQQGITGNYPFAAQVVPPLTELLPRAREAGDAFHEGSTGTDLTLPVADEDVVVVTRWWPPRATTWPTAATG